MLNLRKSQAKCYYECKSDVPPCTSPAECISSMTAAVCFATFLARSARSRRLPSVLPSRPKDIPCTLGPASGKTRHRCVPLGPSTVKESVIVWILFQAALCVEAINASSLGEIDSSAISSFGLEDSFAERTFNATKVLDAESRASQTVDEPPKPNLCKTL